MMEEEAFESVLAAFIETYDVAAIDASDADDADAASRCPPATVASPTAQGKLRTGGQKRGSTDSSSGEDAQPASKKATSYTTMLQRRKRAEVQTLREQVKELEAHLNRLQRARWGALPKPKAAGNAAPSARAGHRRALLPPGGVAVRLSDLWESFVAEGGAFPHQIKVPRPLGPAEEGESSDESKYLESAVAQYRLRRRSELKNRQLKQLMSQQMHLNSSILRLMQKRAMFPGLELLLDGGESERPAETVEYRIPNAEIESEITQLYREVDLVVDRLSSDWLESVSCSMETKHDPAVGRYVEVRTMTPVNHSAAQAAMRVWRKTCSNPDQHLSFFSETTGSESYVKRFFLPIARREEREGGDVLLNVRHHARKFDEAKRFVTVMYAIVQPPVSSMYLREDSWTVVSPSPANPRHESIVQTCYRIHSKMSEPGAPPTEEAAEMCSFVMTALGRLTRRNMQTTQNWLLEEVSSPFPDWILT